MLNDVEFSILD